MLRKNSMIRLYYKGQNLVEKLQGPISGVDMERLLWVDLQDPQLDEITAVEKFFNINIPTRLQQEEIESSSRYTETDDCLVANSNFIQFSDDGIIDSFHVSFVIKGDLLVSYREGDLRSFAECVKKIKANHKPFSNGRMVLLALFETRIDFDADMIESISRKISAISRQLTAQQGMNAVLLKQISTFQELTMTIRESIIDKQRVVSSLLKSAEFINEENERLRIIIKDINSLVDHSNFLFERLEYLQNTFMGFVNIEQNKIIKIFTVVSVIFMPPTLIASIYGMNFKFIPEIGWLVGYPFAIALMVFSSLGTLYIFRRRKWL